MNRYSNFLSVLRLTSVGYTQASGFFMLSEFEASEVIIAIK